MRAAILAVFLLLTSCGLFARFDAPPPMPLVQADGLLLAASTWGWGTESFDGWPPARFTRDRSDRIHFVSPDKVPGECSDGLPNPFIEACSDDHTITLPNPCTFPRSDDYARLVCHELGHRNGWAGNHPR